jgi:AraC-like DNA-binding protein
MTGATLGGQELTKRITEITLANLTSDGFGVSELALKLGISRSNLHRKVRKDAQCSISRFICRVRLQKAAEFLQTTSLPAYEIAYECGFHSVTYFSKCFHDYYGFSPAQARNRDSSSPKSKTHKIPDTQGNIFTLTKGLNKIQSFFKLFQNAAT